MDVTYVEKTSENRMRRGRPLLHSITVPELGLVAIRPDLNARELIVYRGDHFQARLHLKEGAVAESFRQTFREYVESLG